MTEGPKTSRESLTAATARGTAPRGRVLDVGNCSPDHHQIRMLLERHFDVVVEQVMFVDEALEKMRRAKYDLVLFNRIIFEDGSEGLDLVRRARSDPAVQPAPMMMVSNFPDAQTAAVEQGAVQGFGKARLFAPETVERLSRHMKRKDTDHA